MTIGRRNMILVRRYYIITIFKDRTRRVLAIRACLVVVCIMEIFLKVRATNHGVSNFVLFICFGRTTRCPLTFHSKVFRLSFLRVCRMRVHPIIAFTRPGRTFTILRSIAVRSIMICGNKTTFLSRRACIAILNVRFRRTMGLVSPFVVFRNGIFAILTPI